MNINVVYTGHIHGIDMKVMNQVMFDLVKASSALAKDGSCAGGIQLTCKMGAYLKNGMYPLSGTSAIY